jgi:geranylgeranyl pyrophosphate synthase
MEVEELYELFNKKFADIALPYLKSSLPKNQFSAPVWHIIDNFHWRRFRAAMPIIFAEKYGETNKILPLAVASELIFAIALVQDDLIDGDDKRTNIDTAHKVFGVPHTVASFDYVFAFANELLMKTEDIVPKQTWFKIKAGFTEAQKSLYESFILEKLNKGNVSLTEKDILDLYVRKTITGINSLYCAALLCEKAPKTFAEDILEYSRLLGIAGQIKNDVYDLVDWRKYPNTRGYSDLRNGYMTYAIRKLLDKANESEKEIVKCALQTGENANEVLKLIEKYDIIEGCITNCKAYGERAAKVILGKYPEVENILLAWVEGNRRFKKL